MSCEYCEGNPPQPISMYASLKEALDIYVMGGNELTVIAKHGDWARVAYPKINYCPMCGTKLDDTND